MTRQSSGAARSGLAERCCQPWSDVLDYQSKGGSAAAGALRCDRVLNQILDAALVRTDEAKIRPVPSFGASPSIFRGPACEMRPPDVAGQCSLTAPTADVLRRSRVAERRGGFADIVLFQIPRANVPAQLPRLPRTRLPRWRHPLEH